MRKFLGAAKPNTLRGAVLAAGVFFAGLIVVSGQAFAQQIRIVTFGDSGPAGDGVSQSQAYPAVLQAALQAKGVQATVRNMSISGETTAQGLARVGSVPKGTHVVITEFGSNDLRTGVSKAAMDANMDAIAKHLRANGAQVLMMGTRGLDYSAVAGKNGALAISYPQSFRSYIQATGKHLTPEGHRAAVTLMMPKVQTLIARSQKSGREPNGGIKLANATGGTR